MKRAHQLEAWLTQVWYQNLQPGLFGGMVLGTLEKLYQLIRKISKQDEKSAAARTDDFPAILVVGNLIAGGAGKTPIVQAVCTAMKARGHQVGILTRGYKRHSKTPILLEPGESIDPRMCGDEPAWLHENTTCPISVGANRSLALKNLLARHPEIDLVVSDDGLQHHRLPRHLEWVVFDERVAGNKKLLPAGPLREPLSRLSSVDAIISSAVQPENLIRELALSESDPIYFASVNILGFENAESREFLGLEDAIQRWGTQNLLAFTGLANPDKFFRALENAGLKVDHKKPLPDHFDYPENFCADLACDVALTTGKDAVKLTKHLGKVWVARIHVTLPETLISQIEAKIGLTHR